MKKNLKTHLTKGNLIALNFLGMIFLSTLLSSCQKNKYPWEPGISAPKYYPITDVVVDFGNAGNGTRMPFDSGWGNEYGGVVSGERFKDIPKEVKIKYNSGAENYVYQGKVLLDKKKLLNLFRKYNINDKNSAHLIVGMAPGGWIRVWFQTIDTKINDLANIEVAKAKLKGIYDSTVDERYKVKNFNNWGKYYTYWQHHGIPYEAWANNEKEYDIIFDFNKSNPKNEVTDPQYSSLDGTLYYRTPIDSLLKRKLPADLVAVWKSKNSNVYYDTHVTFPKNFSKIIEDRKLKKVVITLEIENDDQYGILYLTSNNKKEKLLRFKTYPSKDKILGNSDFSKDIEYFIK